MTSKQKPNRRRDAGTLQRLSCLAESDGVLGNIYQATSTFPKHEALALTSQLRRAAVSIPSNIAEGQSRFSQREFAHFLANARGSLGEIETQLLIARDLKYLRPEAALELLKSADELSRILTGLRDSIRRQVES